MTRSERSNEKWEYGYNKLLEYYNEYGNCDIPQRYVTDDGYRLGSFVDVQRRYYKKGILLPERKEKLEKLNFTFKKRDGRSFTWDDWYKELELYYKENGNIRVPYDYITPTGHKLGGWLNTQTKAYRGIIATELSDDKIDKLESLGIIWDRRENKWNENYLKAKEIINNKQVLEDPKLMAWYYAQNQRIYSNKATSIEKELITQLNEGQKINKKLIKDEEKKHKEKKNTVSIREINWQNNLELLKGYSLKYPDQKLLFYHLKENKKLYNWVLTQRFSYGVNELSIEKIKQLSKYVDLCPKDTSKLNDVITNDLEYKKLLLKRMKNVLEELDNSVINSKEDQDIIEKEIIKRVWR